MTLHQPAILLAVLAAVGCGAPPGSGRPDAGELETDAGPFDTGPCETTPVSCPQESVDALRLGNVVSPGDVTNALDGADWVTKVDGTRSGGGGGGLRFSYVYGRFDPERGLVKVEIDDQAAFQSMDWDIAFRRAGIRINSGDSGPSCVKATRAPPTLPFDEIFGIDMAQEDAAWRVDDFLSPMCTYIPDGSGLDLPATALSGYFSMGSCLQMRGHTYFIALRDGRHVKLRVESVYTPEEQDDCDRGDSVSFRSHGRFTIRWSFVD